MRRIIHTLSLALLALGLLAGCAMPFAQEAGHAGHAEPDPMSAGTLIEPPTPLTDFTLPSSAGAPLGLADLRGKPTLIFFGFTHCPDICPTTLADFKQAKEALGPDGERVNFVLISVDPARDTPEVLASYVQNFDPAFIGLQGEEATLRRISRDYGLYYQAQPAAADGSYDVQHSSAIYLADAEGRLRVVYSYGTPADTYVGDLRRLLEE